MALRHLPDAPMPPPLISAPVVVVPGPDGPSRDLAALVGAEGAQVTSCPDLARLRLLAPMLRPGTAVIVDARDPDLDRDHLSSLAERHLRCVVIEHPDAPAPWTAIGAAAVVAQRSTLAAVLDAAAAGSPTRGGDATPPSPVVVVTGVGPLAACLAWDLARSLAPALADEATTDRPVLLVDATLHARLRGAVRTDPDRPTLGDLASRHRRGDAPPGELASACAPIAPGLALLAGLHDPDDWLLLRPESSAHALEAARRSASLAIVLADSDLADEATTGSVGIEDRNLLARLAIGAADVVVIAAAPPPWGDRDLEVLRSQLGRLGRTSPAHRVVLEVVAPPGAPRRPSVAQLAAGVRRAVASAPPARPFEPPPAPSISPGELGGAQPAGWITPSAPQQP